MKNYLVDLKTIGDEDSDEEESEDEDDDLSQTKQGYAKDGFVVDDEEDDIRRRRRGRR